MEKCFELYENSGENREQPEEVLSGLLKANDELLKKEEFMTKMEKRFNERFTVFAEKTGMAKIWEQKWKKEGIEEGMQKGMKQLFTFLNQGHSLEEAKKKFAFAQKYQNKNIDDILRL